MPRAVPALPHDAGFGRPALAHRYGVATLDNSQRLTLDHSQLPSDVLARLGVGPCVVSPRSRDDGEAAAPLLVRAAEKRPLGVNLPMAAAAGVIRAPVKNRFDNLLIRTTVANHGRRRKTRSRSFYPLTLIAPLTSRVAAASPSSRDRSGRAARITAGGRRSRRLRLPFVARPPRSRDDGGAA